MTCDNEEREKERDCKREQESQRWSEEQVKRMKEMEEGSEAGGVILGGGDEPAKHSFQKLTRPRF